MRPARSRTAVPRPPWLLFGAVSEDSVSVAFAIRVFSGRCRQLQPSHTVIMLRRRPVRFRRRRPGRMIFRNFRVANSSFFLTNGATSAICCCPFRLGDLRAVPRGIVFGLAIAFVSVCRFLASAQLESCSGFRPAETPGRFVTQIRSSNRRRGERRSAGDLCVASPSCRIVI